MKKFNYENQEYLSKLDQLPASYYSKYIEYLKTLLKKDSKFLDVGCGNGKVLKSLLKAKYKNGYGVDISKLFVKDAKSKGLKNIYFYDGTNLPFKKNFFDAVGSFNVLEHTHNPELFIKKQIEVIKPGGKLLIACPNFLSSVLISPHPRVNGFLRKTLNFLYVLNKLLDNESRFSSMPTIKRRHFEYDDDAIVVTNLIDIKRCLRKYNCRVIYESGFINYDSPIFRIINMIPLIRYTLPSCFVIAEKLIDEQKRS